MKKIISLILTLAMMLTMTTVVMANSPKVNLTYVPVDDTTFDVEVSLEGNPGFATFEFDVEFDKYVITAIDYSKNDIIKTGNFISNIEDTNRDHEKKNTVSFLYYTTSGDIKENGKIFTIHFEYKEAIPLEKQNKETLITVLNDGMLFGTDSYDKVPFTAGTSVTVTAPTTEREPEPGEYDEPEVETPSAGGDATVDKEFVDAVIDSMIGKVYTAEVKNVEEQNKVKYMAMYEDETFKPDAPATRYEVIAALNNLFEITSDEFAPAFADVTEEYKEIVQKFVTAKILNGYEDKTFKGENTITRAEFVKILAVAFDMKLDETATADFTDISGHWAENYIKTFVSGGYTKGYAEADGTFTFRPEGKVTRAEVVAFINRIISVDADASEKLPTDLENADGSQHWAYDEIIKVVK